MLSFISNFKARCWKHPRIRSSFDILLNSIGPNSVTSVVEPIRLNRGAGNPAFLIESMARSTPLPRSLQYPSLLTKFVNLSFRERHGASMKRSGSTGGLPGFVTRALSAKTSTKGPAPFMVKS